MKHALRPLFAALALLVLAATSRAQVRSMNFDDLAEGPLGSDVHIEDMIRVDSLDLYDGNGLGQPLGVERATTALAGFPDFTSPNVLDFGSVVSGGQASFDRFGSLRIVVPAETDRVDVRMYLRLGSSAFNRITLRAFSGTVLVDADAVIIPTGSGVLEVNLSVSGSSISKLWLVTSGDSNGGTCEAVLDEIRARLAPAGVSFCAGDGSGAACPCGNVSLPPSGCRNSTGLGATAEAFGSPSLFADQLVVVASSLPPGVPALLFSSASFPGTGSGTPFGDGLLCLDSPVQRLGVQFVAADGRASWVDQQLLAGSGIPVGTPVHFQVWYRDTQGPCGAGFNLTNAYRVIVAN